MTTRSKGLYNGTIINLDALVRKARDLKHPKNADPDEKIAYYHKVFKDPPNAAQLMRRIAETGAFVCISYQVPEVHHRGSAF